MKTSSKMLMRLAITSFVAITNGIYALESNVKKSSDKISIIDNSGRINANEIDMYVTNHGALAYDISGGSSGLYYPNGQTNNTVIYAAGLWLGGIELNTQQLRVRVGEYSQTFVPGRIFSNGIADDPALPIHRVFEINEGDTPASNIDYAEWPCSLGAPCENGNIPTILGQRTLWAVFNDLHNDAPQNDAASIEKMGMEIQQTIFAYDSTSSAIDNTVFVKFLIINKSSNTFDSMFVSFWSDPDIGGSVDDNVGCEPSLNLGYAYNGASNDSEYGSLPPAVGYTLLQGPLVSIENETFTDTNGNGVFDLGTDVSLTTGFAFGQEWQGHKNMMLTSMNKYVNGTDPHTPNESYNYMNGLLANGMAYIDPTTNQPTKFVHSGNPVSGTGDIDNLPSDKRLMLNSGGLQMAPGDSQEVVYAITVSQFGNNLVAIDSLKSFVSQVIDFYNFTFNPVSVSDYVNNFLPDNFVLKQNFPNPFNPTTNIPYELKENGNVSLRIFNTKGQLVKTLVDKTQNAGFHLVKWNGTDENGSQVSSGVYLYKLDVDGNVEAKKMNFIK